MPRRTYPTDAARVEQAADLEDIVHYKQADWRATGAKARRRGSQRRYKNLLTQQLVKGCLDPNGFDRT